VDQKTDVELVARARGGDKSAFGELVKRHYGTAVRVTQRMVGEEECARELAQEAALQAYLSLDRLQHAGAFRGWLCGIALNLCRSYIRARQVEWVSWESLGGGVYREEAALVDPAPGPEELVEAQELHPLVLEAVGELSPKVRRATLLFYFEQLSLREIAALLGCSVGAVKGRLHKARQELRERLWPLYAELREIEERKMAMTRVEIADVVEQADKNHVVYLLDRENKRCVLVTIGAFEGWVLVTGLRGLSVPRPMTAQFAASILEAVGAELEEVRIEKLENDIFYAVARVRRGDAVKELDSRPSDAMAVAVLKDSPIYVADEVFEKVRRKLTDEEMEALGRGLEEIAEKHQQKTKEQRAKRKFFSETEAPGEDAVQVRIELARGRVDAGKIKVNEVLSLNRKAGELALLCVGEEPRFVGGVVFTEGRFGLKVGRKVQPGDVEGYEEKNLSVEMGRGWLDAEKAGTLGEGSLVLVDKKAGEPVDVLVDGKTVARGEVVTVDENLGVRITEMV